MIIKKKKKKLYVHISYSLYYSFLKNKKKFYSIHKPSILITYIFILIKFVFEIKKQNRLTREFSQHYALFDNALYYN